MEGICKFTERPPSEKNEGWESPEQRELFIDLFRIPFIAENFWLSGGTCLSAMYLGHRQSEDLDFFTTRETVHPNERERIIDILRARYDFDMPGIIHSTFVSMIINGVKVEFVSDMFAKRTERPKVVLNNVYCKVDTWDNLCVAKFSAFLSRISDKDISDVGAILSTAKDDHELREMLNFLICETRKRDSMADELTKISDIIAYASQITENSSYKKILSKSSKIVIEFTSYIAEKVVRYLENKLRATVGAIINPPFPARILSQNKL
jgi:predicted nucleotidyltransferase component of viral defense system